MKRRATTPGQRFILGMFMGTLGLILMGFYSLGLDPVNTGYRDSGLVPHAAYVSDRHRPF